MPEYQNYITQILNSKRLSLLYRKSIMVLSGLYPSFIPSHSGKKPETRFLTITSMGIVRAFLHNCSRSLIFSMKCVLTPCEFKVLSKIADMVLVIFPFPLKTACLTLLYAIIVSLKLTITCEAFVVATSRFSFKIMNGIFKNGLIQITADIFEEILFVSFAVSHFAKN